MKTIAEEYVVISNKVLIEFCKWLDFDYNPDIRRVWYPDYPPKTAHINDMFWDVDDMVTALIYKIPTDVCFDWYWSQIGEWVVFKTLLNYYKEKDKSELKLN